MRLVAWNIRAGGGKRAQQIAAEIVSWGADIVALSEFRSTPSSRYVADALKEDGLKFQASTVDEVRPGQNALLVASRYRLKVIKDPLAPEEPGRWLMVSIASRPRLTIGALHVPNQVTGRKPHFHDQVVELVQKHHRKRFVIMGDTNSGRQGVDEENPVFNLRTTRWFEQIEEAGWIDAFRHLEGPRREYTWYSPNKGNGFRLDQAFLSPKLVPNLSSVTHAWAGASEGYTDRAHVSDHAALLVDLDLG